MDEGRTVLLERVEPLFSEDLLESFLVAVAGEVDAQDPGVAVATGPFGRQPV